MTDALDLSFITAAPAPLPELYEQACAARRRAHAPYSGHQVGAALMTTDGLVTVGCNVENASYGATACAERVAIWKAVSEHGRIQIAHLLVVTDADRLWPPCGMCRQVIAEFGSQCVIHSANLQGAFWSAPFPDLFPHAFLRDDLHQ